MLEPQDAAASGLRCGRPLLAAEGVAARRARAGLAAGQTRGACARWMLSLRHGLRLLSLQCLLLLLQVLLHSLMLERNLLLLAQRLCQRSWLRQRWLLWGRLLQGLLLMENLLLNLLLRGGRHALGGRRTRRKWLRRKPLLLRRLHRCGCAGLAGCTGGTWGGACGSGAGWANRMGGAGAGAGIGA